MRVYYPDGTVLRTYDIEGGLYSQSITGSFFDPTEDGVIISYPTAQACKPGPNTTGSVIKILSK